MYKTNRDNDIFFTNTIKTVVILCIKRKGDISADIGKQLMIP